MKRSPVVGGVLVLLIAGSVASAAGQGGKFISQVVACPVVAL